MPDQFRLPRVYPLTDVQLSGVSHAGQVQLFALGGASLVQVREKHLTGMEFYEEAKAALAVAQRNGVKLIINDQLDVALAIRADGIHLGQDDFSPQSARALFHETAIIGYSTHNVNQAVAALKLPIDYLAIGPIFPTTTKADTSPVLGLEGLRAVRRAIGEFPLVAIGGITEANARAAIEAGADSVAVISALLSDPKRIIEMTRNLIQALTTN
jgi:thiamine-phosphate pyrophosphorylase